MHRQQAMDLGRQRAHTGIRSLPIEGHGKEELLSIWTAKQKRADIGFRVLIVIYLLLLTMFRIEKNKKCNKYLPELIMIITTFFNSPFLCQYIIVF